MYHLHMTGYPVPRVAYALVLKYSVPTVLHRIILLSGTNYADMAEDARIEESVATEILNKTMKYEEEEMYRQMDVVMSHESRVDNTTNSIIQQISEELENEYSVSL